MIVSASQLSRHCGYPRALARLKPKSARVQAAADLGTAFHGAVERWASTGAIPTAEECGADEVRGWVEVLAMTWSPPARALLEYALGVSPNGKHVHVTEEPEGSHQYIPVDQVPLLTAGRADVIWRDGDIAMVLDFKTGRYAVEHPSTNLQLVSLGFAAADLLGEDRMRLGVYYARDGVFEWSDVIDLESPEAAQLWSDVEAAALMDEKPNPGAWCSPCWERRQRRCRFAQETE